MEINPLATQPFEISRILGDMKLENKKTGLYLRGRFRYSLPEGQLIENAGVLLIKWDGYCLIIYLASDQVGPSDQGFHTKLKRRRKGWVLR